MEVSFTPESFEAYAERQELAEQRTFTDTLDDCYKNYRDGGTAADVARAIEDMDELRYKFTSGKLKLSEDDTPFEKLSYTTFRLERRFFKNPEELGECRACSLERSSNLCNAAPCSGFERNGVQMGVFFAVIPIYATATSCKKGYVSDTPDSFDFSPENWNSVKTFIGL